MSATAAMPSRLADRERRAVVASVLLAAAGLWALVGWLVNDADSDDSAMLTMGLGAPLFVATWAAMMAAMMLPAVSPMLDAFIRVQANRRAQAQGAVPAGVFLAGYLAVWIAVGVPAYVVARILEDSAMSHEWLMDWSGRLGGGLIVAAGVYELTPLKRICLGRCRTPMSFIVTSWRDGYAGALRMGVVHGGYCLGCCWLLFAMLFPLGFMNVTAMAAVAALVFAEKALPGGQWLTVAAAAVLIGYGGAVLIQPDLLPAM